MLEFLITSKARRRLFVLLWKDGAAGSASDLAKRARLAYAGAHRELRAMRSLGLVSYGREGLGIVYRANKDHPLRETLTALASAQEASPTSPEDQTRGELRQLGAPLHDEPAPVAEIEDTLVRGTKLAHLDPTVANVLPLCFYRALMEHGVDPERLLERARSADEKQAVGFFLDLTAQISGARELHDWSADFRDHRCHRQRDFFAESSRRGRLLATKQTPPIAKSWGWRMNLSSKTFQSMFEKHIHG